MKILQLLCFSTGRLTLKSLDMLRPVRKKLSVAICQRYKLLWSLFYYWTKYYLSMKIEMVIRGKLVKFPFTFLFRKFVFLFHFSFLYLLYTFFRVNKNIKLLFSFILFHLYWTHFFTNPFCSFVTPNLNNLLPHV